MSAIEIEQSRINIAESGSGASVVMLHGSASAGAQWQPVMDKLPGLHIFAPDMYGCGASDDWRGTQSYCLRAETRIVEALAQISDQPIHLVGHSYGGAVALRFALDHPDLIASLTLIEPVAFHLLKQRSYFDRTLYAEIEIIADAVSDAVLQGDYENGMRCFVDYWNGEGAWLRLGDNRRRHLATMTVKVARQFWAATSERSTLDSYRKIHAPTLIVRGGRSPSPVQRIAQLVAGTIPQANLRTFRSASHMLPLTHPSVIAALIADQIGDSSELHLEAA